MKVLELYSGIGGCAAALGNSAHVVAAVDVSEVALAAYRHNFPHLAITASLESISADRLQKLEADLWWFSPPCQPFTRRGHQRDLEDPRARTFLALLDRLTAVRPTWVAMENVPEFHGSKAHGLLLGTLESAGYSACHEEIRCPSEFGLPNRRRRFYLVASRETLLPRPPIQRLQTTVANCLDKNPMPELFLDPETAARYREAIHVVESHDSAALTTCFTAAYGRSPVRSGSYLGTSDGPRRFSPREILRFFDFPSGYRLPEDLSLRKLWQLVGNSLSLPPMRALLARIPGLEELAPNHDTVRSKHRQTETEALP